MFIISKKRILFIATMFIISVITFVGLEKEEKTVETVTLPVTGKTVVLDAGHGSPDEGAFLLHKENKQLTFYK